MGGLLQGESVATCVANLRSEWRATYLADACFWLPVMTANFALVPAQYRVRTIAAASTVWSVIIDYMAHLSFPQAAKITRANTVSPGNIYFPSGVLENIEWGNPDRPKPAMDLNPIGRIALLKNKPFPY